MSWCCLHFFRNSLVRLFGAPRACFASLKPNWAGDSAVRARPFAARGWRLTQKFALRVKARFNPFRDSAGCTIVMRWQHRIKSNSSEAQTLLLETDKARFTFSASSLAGRRISLPSKTDVLTSSGKKSFDAGATIGERQVWQLRRGRS